VYYCSSYVGTNTVLF
nr:immunoglobulin light chain junction region [Macaca mulatta]MOW72107.1 immunoglobulin light chain junction region [Macaca mulatta]